METRLGEDFSSVRLHTDTAARQSAAEVGACAYTSGEHVVIGDGGGDEHTLAHELSHVVQQRRGPVAGTDTGTGLRISHPQDRFERDAEQNARRALSRPPVSPGSVPAMQRSVGNAAVARRLSQTAPPQAPATTAAPVQRAPDKRKRSDTTDQQTTGQQKIHHFFAPETEQQSGTENLDELRRIATLSPEARQQEFLEKLREAFKNGGWQIETSADGEEYAHKDKTLSTKHDYTNEPEVEGLRWISTVTKRYLIDIGRDPQEVQAAIDKHGKLVIAANTNAANKHLEEENGRKGDLIDWMLKTRTLTPEQAEEEYKYIDSQTFRKALVNARLDRENRHFAGLKTIHEKKGVEVPARYGALLSAIKNGVVIVGRDEDGLHAERRIRKFNGNDTPPYLAGTKRPCATCFSELYAEGSPKDERTGRDTVRPGKFIFNERSNVGIRDYQDTYLRTPERRASDLFKRVDEHIKQTYESRARNNVTVYGAGSDSE